jgi:hypothetical protein
MDPDPEHWFWVLSPLQSKEPLIVKVTRKKHDSLGIFNVRTKKVQFPSLLGLLKNLEKSNNM